VAAPASHRFRPWHAITVAIFLAAAGFVAFQRIPRSQPDLPLQIVPYTSGLGQDFQPSISPDGNRVAFVHEGADGNFDIFVKQQSGEAIRLTSTPEFDLHPAWSPDGQSIAFLRATAEDDCRIIVIPSMGGRERQAVMVGRFDPGHMRSSAGALIRLPSPGPAWSPDGKEIVFRRCLPNRATGCPLHIVNLATSQVRQLTAQVSESADFTPAWSPDGRKIAFSRVTSFLSGDLYVVPSAGGRLTRITHDGTDIRGAVWTPDGRSLVFASNRSGTYGLWKVNLGSANIAPLPAPGENAMEPTVPADGRALIYTDANLNASIWRFDLARRIHERLITSIRQNHSAAWSPDGKRIAFASDRTGAWQVWIAGANGERPAPITSFPRGAINRVVWSPDGKWIAFAASPEGPSSSIFAISADGGAPRRVAPGTEPQFDPVWSRDSQWVYFKSTTEGRATDLRASLAGGAVEPLTGVDLLSRPGIDLSALPGLETTQAGRSWAAALGTIWLYDVIGGKPGLFSYSVSTHRLTRLTDVDYNILSDTPSLSLSPDGRYILYARVDHSTSKIMALRGLLLYR
jgi:Tol biopolymer transport system component